VLTIKQKPYNERVFKLVSQLTERVEAIIENLPAEVAEEFLRELEGKAPDDIEGYPKMLQIRKLDLKDVDSVVGVVAPGYAHSMRLRGADVQRTILYIKPKVIRGESDPSAVVLSRRNPWTMETLPYEPHRSQASITSRRVSVREAQKIQRMRLSERAIVDRELRALGTRVERAHPQLLTRILGQMGAVQCSP
jgi:hypothetical protein